MSVSFDKIFYKSIILLYSLLVTVEVYVFLLLYRLGNRDGISLEFNKNTVLTLFVPVQNKGWNMPSWGTTKKCKNKSSCHFLFQLIILGWLGQEGLKKFFLLGFS